MVIEIMGLEDITETERAKWDEKRIQDPDLIHVNIFKSQVEKEENTEKESEKKP